MFVFSPWSLYSLPVLHFHFQPKIMHGSIVHQCLHIRFQTMITHKSILHTSTRKFTAPDHASFYSTPTLKDPITNCHAEAASLDIYTNKPDDYWQVSNCKFYLFLPFLFFPLLSFTFQLCFRVLFLSPFFFPSPSPFSPSFHFMTFHPEFPTRNR